MDAVTINGKTRTHDEWDAYVADERRMWEDDVIPLAEKLLGIDAERATDVRHTALESM